MNKTQGDSSSPDTGPHIDNVFTGRCKSFPEASNCPKVQEHGQKEEPTNPVPEPTNPVPEPTNPAPDYVRQLHSVLGYEKAEYFLHPPPLDFRISSALKRILDGAQDSLGAQEMWHILRENSQQHLHEDFPEETPEYSESVLKNFAQRPVMQKVSRKRHHLCYIRQALDFYTDMSSLLLANKPIIDSSPGQELGSSGYNHQALESSTHQ